MNSYFYSISDNLISQIKHCIDDDFRTMALSSLQISDDKPLSALPEIHTIY